LAESDELAEQLFDMAVEARGVGVASAVNMIDVELVDVTPQPHTVLGARRAG
jgi:hypothetical protein